MLPNLLQLFFLGIFSLNRVRWKHKKIKCNQVCKVQKIFENKVNMHSQTFGTRGTVACFSGMWWEQSYSLTKVCLMGHQASSLPKRSEKKTKKKKEKKKKRKREKVPWCWPFLVLTTIFLVKSHSRLFSGRSGLKVVSI